MLDHGITDLFVMETAGGAVLYSTSGPNGGLAAYAIGPDGTLSLLDFAQFHGSFRNDVLDRLTVIETGNGPQLVVAGDAGNRLVAYDLAANGEINGFSSITGLSGSTAGIVLDVNQWQGDMLFLANGGNGSIRGYTMDGPTQLSMQFIVADTQATYATSVFALETMTIAGVDYLVGASQTEQGVTAYRIEANGLVATGNLGVVEGIGIMTPTTLVTASVGGRHFVLVGSSPDTGLSGAITVMELRPDGSLMPTDHVIDTLHTRFGKIQSLEVIEADGFTYVIAAGGDDGLTVFALLPNGRLQLLDVMADNFDIGLENVSAVASFHDGTDVHLFISSEISAGITQISFDTSRNGAVVVAGNGGGQTNGTALDDIIVGGAGNDWLSGSFGDDILEDGAGRDTLTGGGGRDIFVLRADGEVDTITDFERGRDRLDLSDWPFLYDPAQVTVVSTATGAIVTWRDETLVINTLNGVSLSAADVRAAILAAPNRTPMDFSAFEPPVGNQTIRGTPANDLLIGDVGNDLIIGGPGNDTLRGGAGDDTLIGGDPDQLSNADGADRFEGGDGRDWVSYAGSYGSLRVDLQFPHVNTFAASGDTYDSIENVWGSQGPDNIRGRANEDNHLYGDRNVDFLYGRSGDDTLDGGIGDDVLFGGPGADLLIGGSGRDRAQYSEAVTPLVIDLQFPERNTGEAAGDIYLSIEDLAGSEFADTISGDAGPNRLFGRNGADFLYGREGDDYLNGGANSDWLDGGPGNDTLRGGTHADTFVFNGGHDVIEDFSYADGDRIAIDDDWIPAVAGMTGAEIADTYGSVVNGRVVLDFGPQGSITILSLTSLDALDTEIYVL